jgi:hypothetical protein
MRTKIIAAFAATLLFSVTIDESHRERLVQGS